MNFSVPRSLKGLAVLLFSITLVAGCASSQKATKESDTKKSDKKSKYEPYSKVITDKAQTDKVLFTVHKVDGKYYYEIPDTLLNQEMLLFLMVINCCQTHILHLHSLIPRFCSLSFCFPVHRLF